MQVLLVRIPHPKIEELALQAQGAGIFAFCEYPAFYAPTLAVGVFYILGETPLSKQALVMQVLLVRIPHQQKTHFCLPTKVRLLNDVCLWQMMRAAPNDDGCA